MVVVWDVVAVVVAVVDVGASVGFAVGDELGHTSSHLHNAAAVRLCAPPATATVAAVVPTELRPA